MENLWDPIQEDYCFPYGLENLKQQSHRNGRRVWDWKIELREVVHNWEEWKKYKMIIELKEHK